jgi:phospholipid/cholesterol/gamma-HCH transport system substrate-binding protein
MMSSGRIASLVALVVVIVAAVVLIGGSDGDRYVVRAELANADGLRSKAAVKISGVPGGTIKDVKITSRDTALVTMELDEGAGPIGRDASLTVRPTDLLGERFADLHPGNLKNPAQSGSQIPLSRTGSSTDLDELLDMLDADTRTRLGILVNEMGIGFTGRGGDLADLLRRMPRSLGKSRRLIASVAAENAKLKRLIEQGDRVASSVEGRRDQLGEFVDSASAAFRALGDSRRDLSATVANAPAGLAALQDTLGRLRRASVSLRPAAKQLNRVAQPLTSTLRALEPFAASAAPTFRKARQVAPSLQRLGVGATPHVRRLAPTARQLRRILQDAVPSIDQLDRRAMKDLLWFIQNWSLALRGRDNLGHFLGGKMQVSTDQLEVLFASYFGGGPKSPNAASDKPRRGSPKAESKAPLEPITKRVPKVRVPIPDVKEVTSKITETVTGITEKLLPKRSAPGGGTGSAPNQAPAGDVTTLLDFFLG